jgi:hypothetical protein
VTPTHSRDLRLDFFRGLALLFIFIDHMPGNRLTGYTIRNFGLSDASELFVFISAYTAGLVHMRRMKLDGLTSAGQRIWRRAGQIYLAHLLVLVVTCALAGWLTRAFDNPQFVQGLNVGPFLERPVQVFLDALALNFQPTFMNILPLYVVLFLFLPLILWLLHRHQLLAVSLSVLLYVLAREWPWIDNPFGTTWQFNPLAWQLLFVIGVTLGAATAANGWHVPRSRVLLLIAAAYAGWALWLGDAAWSYDGRSVTMPRELQTLLFPVMDRRNLSIWRLLHILALSYLVTSVIKRDSPALASRVARPLTLIGQHSLTTFCIGVILSVLGWAVLTELGGGLAVQVLVNVAGIAVMVIIAWLLPPRPAETAPATAR